MAGWICELIDLEGNGERTGRGKTNGGGGTTIDTNVTIRARKQGYDEMSARCSGSRCQWERVGRVESRGWEGGGAAGWLTCKAAPCTECLGTFLKTLRIARRTELPPNQAGMNPLSNSKALHIYCSLLRVLRCRCEHLHTPFTTHVDLYSRLSNHPRERPLSHPSQWQDFYDEQ